MQFRVLGPLEAEGEGGRLDLGTPRQRLLLGLLLLHAGETVPYDRLADDFWEGGPPPTARHTLQSYVHRLRRALGGETDRLQTRPLGYLLKVADGELDAQAFEHLTDHGRRALRRGDAEPAASAFDAALDLWRGGAFEDVGDVVAFDAERARLEAIRLATVEDRFDAGLALGRQDALVPEIEAAVSKHPFRERLWGQLMVAQYRAGRQADALKTFHRAREMLGRELGIQPGRWLCRLQEQILLQDPSLEAPESTDPPADHHRVPAARDSFVGRHREMAELDGLLRVRRLVTITGPPGTGKTRLAVEVARRLTGDWPHGVFVVPLAQVEDPGLAASVIATTLRVPPVPEHPVLETVADHLRSRRVLLVLDNLEHLPESARRVALLLDEAPKLTVLATSRTPLRLAGEQEYPLLPLPTPSPEDMDRGLRDSDAMTLFADRARAVDPDFVVTAGNASQVAEVVARVDGLPLGIELAAARLRSIPLAELARRLEPALPLLTGAPVDRQRQHRTLRDAIAWSDDLLTADEQVALRRLAPFRGGFTVDAAAAVVGDEAGDVVGRLSGLVEASLLGRPTGSAPARYSLLETVREYALERLRAKGEEAMVRGRHAAHFAAAVQQAAPHLTQAGQAHWLEQLDVEHANLRAALAWLITSGDQDAALEMAAGMWRYWQLRGHLQEGRDWLTRVLELEPSSLVPRIRALLGLAGICYWQFDLDAADDAYQRARELARDHDWWLYLEALFGLGMTLACHRGDLAAVAPLEAEFWALIAEHDDLLAMGMGLATSQAMRLLAGDLEGSRQYGEQCLEGTRQVGERWYELQVLRTLALTSLLQEQYDQAREELRGCVRIAVELGDLPGLAMDLDRLGQVAVLLGDGDLACVLAGAADSLRERVGQTITPEAFRWEQERAPIAARELLDETEIDRAFARGRALTLEQVTQVALGAAPAGSARPGP